MFNKINKKFPKLVLIKKNLKHATNPSINSLLKICQLFTVHAKQINKTPCIFSTDKMTHWILPVPALVNNHFA